MNADIAIEWIAALRSGKYKKGKGRLEGIHPTGNEFCCLGVLCRLAVDAGVINEPAPVGRCMAYETEDVDTSLLPRRVRIWAGMFNHHGGRRDKEEDFPALTALNDGRDPWGEEGDDEAGTVAPLSFDEIADYIEENWENL